MFPLWGPGGRQELGYSLDLEANCVWLFHPIDPTPNAKDATVNPEFDVDQAGSEDRCGKWPNDVIL